MTMLDDQVWAGIERRLEAIEAHVPDPQPWREPSGSPRRRSGVVRLGSAFGPSVESIGRRPIGRTRLVWALILIAALVAILAGGILIGSVPPQPDPDPSSSAFGPTGILRGSDSRGNVALLPDGKVLLLNGRWSGMGGTAVSVPELWHPTTGQLTKIDPTIHARVDPTTTLLLDGRVLVVGGFGGPYAYTTDLNAVEIWEPSTGIFTETGPMAQPRRGHSATLLQDGRVLVVGGRGVGTDPASAEVWDPRTGEFVPAGRMAVGRLGHSATLLPDGRVLITGGVSEDGTGLAVVEVWDPRTSGFGSVATVGGGPVAGSLTATRLADGAVLLVGGPSSAVFEGDSLRPGGSPGVARTRHAAVLLADGRVLILGGVVDGGGVTDDVEIFDPTTRTFTPAPALPRPIADHTASLMSDGQILIVSAPGGPDPGETIDIYSLGEGP